MDRTVTGAGTRLSRLAGLLKTYRYPVLILLLGLLLLWPWKSKKTAATRQSTEPTQSGEALPAQGLDYRETVELELAEILSHIDGAGRVRVMLTLRSGASTIYQTDDETQTELDGEKSSTAIRKQTVILSAGSSYNEAAVVRQDYPAFLGALIVSDGGDDDWVRYQLTSAVSALLGIGTDKITVVKMKTSMGE